MLSPEFLAALPESVVALFLQVEEDLLEDIARRIAKMDGITDTAKWQAWRYEQVKLFSSNALQTLATATGKSKAELVQIFREAALETLAADNEIYTGAGLTVPETLSPTLQNILQSGYLQTGQMMENFTATTANTVTRQFENALDRAWLQINTGGFTYQQAIRKAIQTLAQDGLSAIVYPSGHRDTIETAVRRAVLTGVNQTAAKLQIARMEEMGCEFVEVTAHPGARPSHAVWQGKVFHRGDGTSVNGVYYPPFVQSTGYGTGAALGGWNCRHNFFPFFPSLSKRAYTNEMLAQLDAKEISYQGKDYTRYEASQMQRALERKIRKAKREYLSLDAAGQDTAESAVKLRQARAQLNDFLKETGLRQDNFREQVAGFGRSAAAKATALAERSHKAWLKSIGAEKTELNTLAKYYEGKYHNSIEYQRLMGYSKAVEKADISPLVGFDTYQEYCESVQKNIIGQTTSTGVRLESFALHFIDRLIGQTSEPHPGKRLGVSVEDALDALINPVSVSDVRTAPSGDKRQTFTGKKTDVTISITDKLLIQTNPRGK